jgi:outer membrane protein OmpA-like peptidoglycan-associated protein
MKDLQHQMRSLQAQLQPQDQAQPQPQQTTNSQPSATAAPYADIDILEQPIMNYVVDGVDPTSSMLTELDRKADILKKYPALHIICTGYTCNLGAEDFNNFIGLKRAEATRSYFVQRGIDGNRIEVKSGGHHNPSAPKNSDANRKKNSRVEISVK